MSPEFIKILSSFRSRLKSKHLRGAMLNGPTQMYIEQIQQRQICPSTARLIRNTMMKTTRTEAREKSRVFSK